LLLTFILGSFVGLMMGLTGAGGAILSVPLLITVDSLTLIQATPISLISVAISAWIGTIWGLKTRIVRYKAAVVMSIVGILASPLGISLARVMPQKPLIISFGMLLAFISIRMLMELKEKSREFAPTPKKLKCEISNETGRFIWTPQCFLYISTIGIFTGFFSGLLGVGGGFIIVPMLKRFTNLEMTTIISTALGVIAIVSTGGAIISITTATVNWSIGLPFTLGSSLGLLIGRKLALRLNTMHVQKIFALFLMYQAINIVYKNIFLGD